MALSVADQLTQLEAARQLVLADSILYPQIVQGILPIVGVNARIELRRWGAEFLAETFASPVLGLQQKESLSVKVLPTLKDLLEIPEEDAGVVKSVVQTAASIYSLIFHHIITNPHDSPTWETMASIKSNILKRWDTGSTGVRTCCIKFVQRVVQVQTPGVIADPRRPEQNEISLALVPRDHPLIPPPKLEPEASGLLDRLLNVFHEDTSDAVLVTATLNCLGALIRTRPSITNKIVLAILNFNPMKQANSPMTSRTKLEVKSMERTTRALLMNVYRRNDTGPYAARIKNHVDRLAQARIDIFDEGSRKRGLPGEPTDGLDNVKRMRIGAEVPSRSNPPPLPSGPTSIAQLFTLSGDEGLTSFDVTQLPIDLVVRITLPVLHQINQLSLDEAIDNVRSRYLALSRAQQIAAQPLIPQTNLDDEEDDYEPDFQPMEDTEQMINKADALPPEDFLQTPTDLALGPYKLPQPPPFTPEEISQIGKTTVSRVFRMMNVLDDAAVARRPKPGLNRLAGSNYDQEAWITIIARLATRSSTGLEVRNIDDMSKTVITQEATPVNLTDVIRENLWRYIVEDFRSRIHIAILWLNEEWLNDYLEPKATNAYEEGKSSVQPKLPHYDKWVLKVLDMIVPFLDAKDKLLIRFLSEIPAIDERILERVKKLARDPERVTLAVNAIHYLILGRPPVREMCLDAIEDLWRNYDDAKVATTKVLAKWRPHVLSTDINGVIEQDQGVKEGTAGSPSSSSPLTTATTTSTEESKQTQPSAAIVAAIQSVTSLAFITCSTPFAAAIKRFTKKPTQCPLPLRSKPPFNTRRAVTYTILVTAHTTPYLLELRRQKLAREQAYREGQSIEDFLAQEIRQTDKYCNPYRFFARRNLETECEALSLSHNYDRRGRGEAEVQVYQPAKVPWDWRAGKRTMACLSSWRRGEDGKCATGGLRLLAQAFPKGPSHLYTMAHENTATNVV